MRRFVFVKNDVKKIAEFSSSELLDTASLKSA